MWVLLRKFPLVSFFIDVSVAPVLPEALNYTAPKPQGVFFGVKSYPCAAHFDYRLPIVEGLRSYHGVWTILMTGYWPYIFFFFFLSNFLKLLFLPSTPHCTNSESCLTTPTWRPNQAFLTFNKPQRFILRFTDIPGGGGGKESYQFLAPEKKEKGNKEKLTGRYIFWLCAHFKEEWLTWFKSWMWWCVTCT